METRTPDRRRTADALSDRVAMPLTRLMNVPIAAVVEMLGTCRHRMAFI